MDAAEARAWIERYTAADQAPTLDSDDVDSLLDLALLDRGWQADYVYATGATIVVDDQRWTALYGGTSGLTSPTFTGTSVVDNGVTWEPSGDPAWDLFGAAAEGWRLKAGKIAGGYDFAMEGASWSRSQAYEHAIQMAAMLSGRSIAPTTSSSRSTGSIGQIVAKAPSHVAYGEFGLTYDDMTGSDPRYR